MLPIVLDNNLIPDPKKLTIISGPCVLEDEFSPLKQAELLKELFSPYASSVNFIFKASYDKANRSSLNSFRGLGLKKGLAVLEKIKSSLSLPILTDVHSPLEAQEASSICDILQIPAFLARQTDLVIAIAKTGAIVNVKKSQFMSPWEIRFVIDKIRSSGNDKIIITERGFSFGYNNLVSDMRAIPIMQKTSCPVFFDGTHSVQLPGSLSDKSGGQTEFIPTLTCAALAAGCNGLFVESHPNPKDAKSDSQSMLDFQTLALLIPQWLEIYLTTTKYIYKNLCPSFA